MYASVRELRSELTDQLSRGRHVTLYGPRGSGKSTLVSQLHRRLLKAGVPCAVAHSTSRLDDITRSLETAYPGVDTKAIARRAARGRLWRAADQRPGVLLLDHLTEVSTAMLGFLRRLRGGFLGVLYVVDVDVERERQRMRARHLPALSVRMPPTPGVRLRRMLRSAYAEQGLSLDPDAERRILRAAHGRPGWIVECARRMPEARYWHGARLFATVLCSDTEIALRQGDLDLLPREITGSPQTSARRSA
jgi:predicted ATPase